VDHTERRRFCRAVALGLAVSGTLMADQMIRVGLIQMDGKTFDKEYNLARAEKWIRRAAARAQSWCALRKRRCRVMRG